MLNIDLPITLGIIVMFVRSTIDIAFDYESDLFDSLTGLIFFMLLGKMFHIKTYRFLSFERDFKSYFPIAITHINSDASEQSVPVYDIEKGGRLVIRNQALIPVDEILISEKAAIDYSFVIGEVIPIRNNSGDKVFASGKEIGKVIEMEVLYSVFQSYLTQVCSIDVFQNTVNQRYKSLTDSISRYFTPVLLLIAFATFGYWILFEMNTTFNVLAAILIVACPCAMALTAPFTMSNVLRIVGKQKFYFKNTLVIEQVAKFDTIAFDKTGTITTNKKAKISYEGQSLSNEDLINIKTVLRRSNHPLSRMLFYYLPELKSVSITDFEEITIKGTRATIQGRQVIVVSAAFGGSPEGKTTLQMAVHVSINDAYCGKYFSTINIEKD
jgi:Cu+-exporting ATPase